MNIQYPISNIQYRAKHKYPISNIKYLLFSIVAFFCFLNVSSAHADYYAQGILASGNLLSGAQTVSAITDFKVSGTIPANTTVSIKFSQDNVNYYNSNGVKEGWDSCANGVTTVNISGLAWTGGSLFYKLQLTSTDVSATPTVGQVQLDYSGTIVPPLPASPFYAAGAMVSTDLLAAGASGKMTGVDRFGYGIASMPYGTSVTAQFSTDNINWYGSDGVLWDSDTLVFGDHLSPTTALSLSALNWQGATSFYYKLNFYTNVDNNTSPIVKSAGLLEFSATAGGAADTSAAPVAWYKFNEGVGGTAFNSGSGGSALNGALPSGSAPTWTNDGKFGKALSFNGTDESGNYVQLFNTVSIGGQRTIAAWVKTTTTRSLSTVWGDDKQGILRFESGVLKLYANDGSFKNVSKSGINDGQWHHIVGVINSGTGIKLYVDGALADSTSLGTLDTTTYNAKIGANYASSDNPTQFFDGKIDEVKIWNYALTADQVKKEYNGGNVLQLGSSGSVSGTGAPTNAASGDYCVPGDTTTCAAPVGEWKMDEHVSGDAKTIYDTSGNGNNGTTHYGGNATGMNCSVQGKIGGGCSFDGVDDYVSVSGTNSVRTISFWMKPSNTTQTGTIVDLDGGTSRVVAYNDGSNFTINTLSGALTVYIDGKSTNIIPDKNWHFVTVIFGSSINATYISFGAIRYSLTSFYSGAIDNIRFYNYARSASQIAWEYNQGAPVASYRFNECTGTTAHDESGNGNNGTINLGSGGSQTQAGTCASPTDGTGAWYNGRTGKYGASLNFDGVDDYVQLGTAPYFNSNNPFTLSAWVYSSSYPSSIASIVGTAVQASPWDGIWFYLDHGKPYFILQSANGASSWAYSSAALSAGNWHHVVATYDGSGSSDGMNLYVDGVAPAITKSRMVLGTITQYNWVIGADSTHTADFFNGQIDDVKIFNYALTSQQVANLYNASSAVNFGN